MIELFVPETPWAWLAVSRRVGYDGQDPATDLRGIDSSNHQRSRPSPGSKICNFGHVRIRSRNARFLTQGMLF